MRPEDTCCDPGKSASRDAVHPARSGGRPIVFCIDSPGLGGAELNLVRIMTTIGPDRIALLHGDRPDSTILEFVSRAGIPSARVAFANALSGAPRGICAAVRAIARNPRACYVIWAHHADTCRWLQLTLALLRRRYVIAEQAVVRDASVYERSKLSRPLKRIAVRHAAAVVLNASSQLRRYAQIFGVDTERLAVIASSRDTHAIRSTVERLRSDRAALRRSLLLPDAPVVVCVSRLAPGKDQATIIKALASERFVHRNAHLVLVGDGPDRPHLEQLASSLAPGRVLFAGHRSDPLPWLAAADVFAFMSHAEGLPGALIEALAAGLPCVATDIPGNSELVLHGKTGLLVPVGAVDPLSSAIAELLDAPDRARTLALEGTHRVLALYDQATEHALWKRLLAAGGDARVLSRNDRPEP